MSTIYYKLFPHLKSAEKCLDGLKAHQPDAYFYELNDKNRVRAEHCIYITGLNTGVPESDVAQILNESGVLSWLVIIADMNGADKHEYEIIKDKWEQELHGIDAAVKIIPGTAGYEQTAFDWIAEREKFSEAAGSSSGKKLCLIVSKRPQAGKSILAELLGASSRWDISETQTDSDDYILLRDNAARIIFVGSEYPDFEIPCFEDALRKSIFLCNKCDMNPILMNNPVLTKKDIIKILRKNNWGITEGQTSKIFVGSTLYSWFYAGLMKYKSEFFKILLDDEGFAIWNEYGLPIPRSEYTEEKAGSFLLRFDFVSEMRNHIYMNG
jgi:hypothetical protein